MKRRNQSGVTLMELLVSIMLLSLLSLGMLFAFRIGLNAMSKANDRVMSNRRVLGVERVFTQQIAGYVPVKANCRAGADQAFQQLPFFQGEPQTMRFVSTYSLEEAARGYPRILEYQVIPGKENRGVRLIVNELLYTGPFSTGAVCLGQVSDPAAGVTRTIFTPVVIGERSFVLADNLARCRFLFKDDPDPTKPPIWRDNWVKETIPSAVRVDMVPLEIDPADIQLPPITVAFRPKRSPMKEFVDHK